MAIALGVVGLLGCASSTPRSDVAQNFNFTQAKSQSAIIVVGLRLKEYPTELGLPRRPKEMDIFFRRLDGGEALVAGRGECSLAEAIGSGRFFCGYDETHYYVLSAAPGAYELSHTYLNVVRDYATAGYRREKIRWSVAEGEIIYLGDFVLAPVTAAIVGFSRDDAAANLALQKYPNINGSVTFREMSPPAVSLFEN